MFSNKIIKAVLIYLISIFIIRDDFKENLISTQALKKLILFYVLKLMF